MKIPHIAKTSRAQIISQVVTLGVTWLTLTSTGSATYLGWKSDENRLHEKSNRITATKRYGPVFKSDRVSTATTVVQFISTSKRVLHFHTDLEF